MFQYIARRTLYAIPVLLAILIVTFTLARLIPGDPCTAMLGEKATEESCARFDKRFGLDKPLPVQLAVYMGNIVRAIWVIPFALAVRSRSCSRNGCR